MPRAMPRARGAVRLPGVLAVLVLAVPALLGASPDGSGETIPLSGREPGQQLDVTLTRVVDPTSPAGTEAPAVGDADRLVAVRFHLENTGAAVYKDSPTASAHVLDTTGQRFSGLNTATTAGAAFPDTVTLSPGDSAEGFVTFRLPRDSALAAAQFALNGGFADDVGQWSLP